MLFLEMSQSLSLEKICSLLVGIAEIDPSAVLQIILLLKNLNLSTLDI